MKVYRTVSIEMQNGYSFFTTEKERRNLTYLSGLCLAEHRLLLSARLGVSSSYLLTLVAAVRNLKSQILPEGMFGLKDIGSCRMGEGNIGEEHRRGAS